MFLDGETGVARTSRGVLAISSWEKMSEPGMIRRECFLVKPDEELCEQCWPSNWTRDYHTPMKLGLIFAPL